MATSGIGSSNLDINNIISQLMTVEQRPLTALTKKEASYQARLSAYGSIKGALAGFQSAVSGLSNIGKFKALKATPSDTSAFSASATSIAVPGAYSIEVSRLAQSQKLVTAGQSSSTAAIGTGTLTFDFGTISGNTFSSATGKYGTTLSASTTNGSTTVTVASTASLAVGAAVSGTGIPAGATISSITDSTHFVLSAAATADGAGVSLQATATYTSNGAGAKTVSIGSANSSLQGIRDAINAAKIGVTATIINDGGASPYRLALTSNSIGKINSMKISVAESGAPGLAALLAHDPSGLPAAQHLTETAMAQNAEFTVDGLAMSKSSNTVSDVIQGVTLNLQKTTASPASLTVDRDTAAIKSSVEGFVKTYNDLNKALKDVSAYDPATRQGAVLQGDSTIRALQSKIHSVLNVPVGNTGGTLTTLSQIGVSFQKDGTLALDASRLNAAISNNFNEIAGLFAAAGSATDSLVSHVSSADTTKPGSYAVNVTTLATQGSATGSYGLNAAANTIAANTVINVNLDGTAAQVALAAGSYTASQLAAMVQSAINGNSAISAAGSSVAATVDGSGFLKLTSSRYGSASSISLSSGTGTAISAFMGAVTAASGTDVAGTINGMTANGTGQYLTSAAGDSAGLKILIDGGLTGARGTVNYSQGYAYTLDTLVSTLLAGNGPLSGKISGVNSSIKDIGKQRDELNLRLAAIEKRYRAQFTALDSMLSSMNQTSTYLTQQLANLPKPY